MQKGERGSFLGAFRETHRSKDTPLGEETDRKENRGILTGNDPCKTFSMDAPPLKKVKAELQLIFRDFTGELATTLWQQSNRGGFDISGTASSSIDSVIPFSPLEFDAFPFNSCFKTGDSSSDTPNGGGCEASILPELVPDVQNVPPPFVASECVDTGPTLHGKDFLSEYQLSHLLGLGTQTQRDALCHIASSPNVPDVLFSQKKPNASDDSNPGTDAFSCLDTTRNNEICLTNEDRISLAKCFEVQPASPSCRRFLCNAVDNRITDTDATERAASRQRCLSTVTANNITDSPGMNDVSPSTVKAGASAPPPSRQSSPRSSRDDRYVHQHYTASHELKHVSAQDNVPDSEVSPGDGDQRSCYTAESHPSLDIASRGGISCGSHTGVRVAPGHEPSVGTVLPARGAYSPSLETDRFRNDKKGVAKTGTHLMSSVMPPASRSVHSRAGLTPAQRGLKSRVASCPLTVSDNTGSSAAMACTNAQLGQKSECLGVPPSANSVSSSPAVVLLSVSDTSQRSPVKSNATNTYLSRFQNGDGSLYRSAVKQEPNAVAERMSVSERWDEEGATKRDPRVCCNRGRCHNNTTTTIASPSGNLPEYPLWRMPEDRVAEHRVRRSERCFEGLAASPDTRFSGMPMKSFETNSGISTPNVTLRLDTPVHPLGVGSLHNGRADVNAPSSLVASDVAQLLHQQKQRLLKELTILQTTSFGHLEAAENIHRRSDAHHLTEKRSSVQELRSPHSHTSSQLLFTEYTPHSCQSQPPRPEMLQQRPNGDTSYTGRLCSTSRATPLAATNYKEFPVSLFATASSVNNEHHAGNEAPGNRKRTREQHSVDTLTLEAPSSEGPLPLCILSPSLSEPTFSGVSTKDRAIASPYRFTASGASKPYSGINIEKQPDSVFQGGTSTKSSPSNRQPHNSVQCYQNNNVSNEVHKARQHILPQAEPKYRWPTDVRLTNMTIGTTFSPAHSKVSVGELSLEDPTSCEQQKEQGLTLRPAATTAITPDIPSTNSSRFVAPENSRAPRAVGENSYLNSSAGRSPVTNNVRSREMTVTRPFEAALTAKKTANAERWMCDNTSITAAVARVSDAKQTKHGMRTKLDSVIPCRVRNHHVSVKRSENSDPCSDVAVPYNHSRNQDPRLADNGVTSTHQNTLPVQTLAASEQLLTVSGGHGHESHANELPSTLSARREKDTSLKEYTSVSFSSASTASLKRTANSVQTRPRESARVPPLSFIRRGISGKKNVPSSEETASTRALSARCSSRSLASSLSRLVGRTREGGQKRDPGSRQAATSQAGLTNAVNNDVRSTSTSIDSGTKRAFVTPERPVAAEKSTRIKSTQMVKRNHLLGASSTGVDTGCDPTHLTNGATGCNGSTHTALKAAEHFQNPAQEVGPSECNLYPRPCTNLPSGRKPYTLTTFRYSGTTPRPGLSQEHTLGGTKPGTKFNRRTPRNELGSSHPSVAHQRSVSAGRQSPAKTRRCFLLSSHRAATVRRP